MNIGTTLRTAKTVVTSTVGLKVLAAQKHSPHILFGAGVVGVVGTVVLASRATLKLETVVEEFEAKKRLAHELKNDPEIGYDETMAKNDGVVLRAQFVTRICKLYAPAFFTGVAAIGCLGGSHYILNKRNAQLVATLGAVQKALSAYRDRVKNEVGVDREQELYYGVTEREVHAGEKKNGEQKIEKVRSFGEGVSPYAKIFDVENINWQPTPSYNLFFLRMVQNQLNDSLRANGHVFLNDAYRALGYTDTEAGAVCGWFKDGDGDGFVDLGIWTDRRTQEQIKPFMQGANGSLMLDFNVDGPIHKKLGKGGLK